MLLSANDQKESAAAAANYLLQSAPFKESRFIASYLPFRGELDTQPLIKGIWKAGKIGYLPILIIGEGKTLEFARYDEGDVLEPNHLSILEPADSTRKIQPEHLEMVILPLVAFDLQGNRLGTGGGYYDRTFAFMHAKPIKRPLLIGLSYSFQQVDLLPKDPWDVKLDAILTEKGLRFF